MSDQKGTFFVKISLKPVYSSMFVEKLMVLRLLENTILSEKIKNRYFYLGPLHTKFNPIILSSLLPPPALPM